MFLSAIYNYFGYKDFVNCCNDLEINVVHLCLLLLMCRASSHDAYSISRLKNIVTGKFHSETVTNLCTCSVVVVTVFVVCTVLFFHLLLCLPLQW